MQCYQTNILNFVYLHENSETNKIENQYSNYMKRALLTFGIAFTGMLFANARVMPNAPSDELTSGDSYKLTGGGGKGKAFLETNGACLKTQFDDSGGKKLERRCLRKELLSIPII